MGKQINFFMLPEDEKLFLDFVLKDPNVVIITESNKESGIREIDRSAYLKETPKRRFDYLFWMKTQEIKTNCIHQVEYKQYNEVDLKFIPTGETGYRINKISAPVIEYDPSNYIGDGIIKRGRIWADMRYVENGEWVYKGKDFESWYDRIARWLRRNYSRTPDTSFFYLGPFLLELYKAGKVKYSWPFVDFTLESGEFLLKG